MRIAPLLVASACASASAQQQDLRMAPRATPDEAKSFVAKVNQEALKFAVESSTADWIKNTYITDDTERNAASANERSLAYAVDAAKNAVRFKDLQLDPDTARMLYLLRISSPVIEDPQKRLEMTTLAAKLEGFYGKAKDAKGRDLEQLSDVMRLSHD